jgi:hypothetical protein
MNTDQKLTRPYDMESKDLSETAKHSKHTNKKQDF